MARTLEFYFDYGSPSLADTQAEVIAKRGGATLVRKPMLLGGDNDRQLFVEKALTGELN